MAKALSLRKDRTKGTPRMRKLSTGNVGFAIVFAKFWRLSSAEESYPEMAFQLISDTFVPNELMRRCLVRRQSESLTAEVYALPAPVVMCRIKRTDTVGEP